MPEATINVAIKKPIHAKLRQLAKAEERDIRTVTNRILNEALVKAMSSGERQPQPSTN
jgi:hypothetical protein